MALCVCLSQVVVLSKGMNGLIWFLAGRLLLASSTLCFKEIQVSAKISVCVYMCVIVVVCQVLKV